MRYYLVANLGLRSIRVILFDQAGTIIERNWYPVQTLINNNNVEQDPNQWWALCRRLLKEILGKDPKYLKNLQSISVTSSASCLVVLDEKGKCLMNSLMVSDKRSGEEAMKLKELKSLRKVFSRPNNLASAAFMVPKISWIKNHKPKIFRQAKHFLSSNDYLIYKLSGQFVTDTLNAEKFYFDHIKFEYPSEVLRQLDIKKEVLPIVVEVGTAVGGVSKENQKEFGFNNETKVVVSSYDAICAFVGSGVANEGDTNNVCGTVSSVRTMTRKKIKGRNGILSQPLNDFNMIGGLSLIHI